ncbi:MAG TPA: hypothetical protein PKA90_15220 [Ignavibacteria bacterium]|nr:hypothetical protein [Ignavibacteria bacterium]HMR41769.1 hypothetical protein [Ignavibacteria bacterium]
MTSDTKESKKIERKKFFMYSGAAALGIFAIIKNPFKLLGIGRDKTGDKKPELYSGEIKITQNPNAVTRNISRNISRNTGRNTTKLNNG